MPKITVARLVDSFTGETVHEIQVDAEDFTLKMRAEHIRLRVERDRLHTEYSHALDESRLEDATKLYQQMTDVHSRWLELGRCL